jgi:hypothetical protein
MSYGTIKVDTITFTDNSVDKSVSLSGLIQNPTFTGNITVTGTISGDVIRGGTTVSGATVTGTTANFVSGVFTTQISGATVTGTTASFTSGVFTNISGTAATITSGIIASGTAAAPSLAILADLDTGLFSPGANELAVATNGTGKLFIDATGNVGVGPIQSPSWASASSTVLSILDSAFSNVAALRVVGPTTITEVGAGPSFTFAGSFSNHPYQLYTNSIERLRVTSAGLVGIGASNPTAKLESYFSSTNPSLSSNTGAGLSVYGTSTVRLNFGNYPASPYSSWVQSSDGIGNAWPIALNPLGGNVGIGTTSPSTTLSVAGGISGTAGANISGAGWGVLPYVANSLVIDNNAGETRFFATGADATTRGSFIFYNGETDGGAGAAMVIDSSSRVGIGTTAPLSNFVVSNSGAEGIELVVNQPDGANTVQYFNYNRSSATYQNVAYLAASHQWRIGNDEKARIDSSGRLLVGTSTARANFNNSTESAALQLEGTAANRRLSITGADNAAVTILARQRSGAVGGNTILQDNDLIGVVRFEGSDGTEFVQAASIACEVDGTPGANDMPGRLTFSTTADGAASPTERLRITSAGLVGIGTTTPDSKLSVDNTRSDTAGSGFFAITGNTSAKRGLRLNTTNGLCFDYYDGSTWSQQAVLTSGGLVGIGTTSPGYKLHVDGSVLITQSNDLLFGTASGPAPKITNSGNQNSLSFFTNGSESVRIDGSKRLLVGTSTARSNFYNTGAYTPTFQLESTAGSSGGTMAALIGSSADAFGAYFIFAHQRSGTIGGNTIVNSGDTLGAISFQGSDGSEFVPGASIEAAVDGTPGANDMPSKLMFSTTADGSASPTERMRINNGGITYIYSDTDPLVLGSAVGAGTTNRLINGIYNRTSTTGGGTQSFVVFTNGNVQNTNNSYTALSDIKLKENIVDASSQWDDIKAFQVRNYNLKEGQTHKQIGLIAQEVEPISPGLVYESPDCDAEGNDLGTVTKSVNYSVLYMKAVKALQEAMERIEQLEAKVAALESAKM